MMDRSSTSPDGLAEDVDIQSIVILELKFYDVQRQIFVADLMEVAHNAALDDRPEPSIVFM
jgi:hypothetical protein